MSRELSLMTFSMLIDGAFRRINAGKLCALAKKNDISMLDMMDIEVKIYGEKKLQKAMQESGVACGCLITAPTFYTDPGALEKELQEAVELTRRMGAEYLMVVPGQATERERKVCSRMSRQQMLDVAVEGFKLAVELANPYDIRVGFENTPHDYKPLASPEDCRYVLDHVPGLGLIFDTGNFRVADTDCDEMAVYEELKEYIIRVHLKDVAIGSFRHGEACVDGQKIKAVMTGSGVIPMERLLQAMKRDGYDGALAVEYAAPKNIHNENAHADVVAEYCRFIREALGNGIERPPYAEIPGIPIPVSRIFFGTAIAPMLMGRNVDSLLDSMAACGINAFDCARGYGKAENVLGGWMRSRNNRSRCVILTKCGNVSMGGKVCVNRKVITEELEKSLEALQTDYIDIYLLHRDDPNTSVGEIIECLNEAKRTGKIRVFGVSNWTHQRIAEANAYAKAHDLEGFAVSSPNFGLAEQVDDPWGGGCVTISGPQNEDARNWYVANGMPVIAYSSLGRGFFSGKFKAGDIEGAKKALDGPARKGYLCQSNMERLRAAEDLAKRDNCTVPQIAMRYIFSSHMNMFAIVSASRAERMKQNIEAANRPLSDEDVRMLEG